MKRTAAIISAVILASLVTGCSSAPTGTKIGDEPSTTTEDTRYNYEVAVDKEAYNTGYDFAGTVSRDFIQSRYINNLEACRAIAAESVTVYVDDSYTEDEALDFQTDFELGCFDRLEERGF